MCARVPKQLNILMLWLAKRMRTRRGGCAWGQEGCTAGPTEVADIRNVMPSAFLAQTGPDVGPGDVGTYITAVSVNVGIALSLPTI